MSIYEYNPYNPKYSSIIMSRFDKLKGNTFTSSSSASFTNLNRRTGQPQRSSTKKYYGREKPIQTNADSLDLFGNELFPELVKKVANNINETPVKASDWIDALQTKELTVAEDNTNYKINVNNPKYWKGAEWIGPMLMRGSKNISSPWNKYMMPCDLRPARVHEICLVNNIEYSRDGTKWYSSWEETFTSEQLENLAYQNELAEMDAVDQICSDNYNRVVSESTRYYNETGELDDYAKAEIDRYKYNEYASQFEVDIEDTTDVETDIMVAEDEEYLEDDY